MAQDDYFVVAYRVLTYLYTCFKAGERPDVDCFGPAALGINNGYWVYLMESLALEGYVKGIDFPWSVWNIVSAKVGHVKITEKGIVFLQENGSIQKAARFLRSVKDTVPGF